MTNTDEIRPAPVHRLVGRISDADVMHKIMTSQISWGLRAQGHIPRIQAMLSAGKSWHEIGASIGWCPDTARLYYARECAQPNDQITGPGENHDKH